MRRLSLVSPEVTQEILDRADARLAAAQDKAKELRSMTIGIDPEKTIMSWNQFDNIIIMAFFSGMYQRDVEMNRSTV